MAVLADKHENKDPKSNRDHANQTLALLFDLPAELRNDIYRSCLTDASRFSIKLDDSFKIPDLLQVSRQIRSEASSIFFLENMFAVDFSDFNCSIYRAFTKQPLVAEILNDRRTGHVVMYPAVPHENNMVWKNLLEWLKLSHDDVWAPRPFATNFLQRRDVAAHAFDIVARMRGKLPWVQIEEVLEVYKRAVEQVAYGKWKWT